MWCTKLILIICLGLVACRPQNQPSAERKSAEVEPQVEIERQIIHEVIPLSNSESPHQPIQRNVDANTKEILDKIAEVNKKQGLLQKKAKPNYFHFPFSYSRSQEDTQRSNNNFKFARDPFTNPILDYVEKDESNKEDNVMETASFRRPNYDSQQHAEGFGLSVTDSSPEITPDDIVPGQYIKRKITHYQSFMMPNPMFNMAPTMPPLSPGMYSNPNNNYGSPNQQLFAYPMYPYSEPNNPQNLGGTKNETALQKLTVDNIKNIITGNQVSPPTLPNYNNYYQLPQIDATYTQNQQYLPPNIFSSYRPLKDPGNKARQNWNWPGANLFPIYIRDPFLQMYYAVTNMVEYGPTAGNGGPCKLTPRPQGSRIKPNSKLAPDIENNKGQQVTFEMHNREGADEIKISEADGSNLTDDIRYMDVEEIDVGNDDLVKFTINLPPSSSSGDGRKLKGDLKSDKMNWNEFVKVRNNTRLSHLASGKLDFTSEVLPLTKQSTIIKDPVLQIEEIEDDPVESEKAEDIHVSNQGSRKVISKDNTGNGIFINKLKVRKGGVAIAGPGGIATAGSGGTAIVGPNGVAYTHPDGLAIAGSGTKVVAVDPNIDLNEVIKNSVLNGTRHVPNTRVGKVVAVGPVVYYNRVLIRLAAFGGLIMLIHEPYKDTTRITLVPFYGGGKGQSLQITENSQGQVISSVIIKTPDNRPTVSEQTEIEIDPSELENPPLPSKFDTEHFEGYDEYIKNIQNRAIAIVELQEIAKKNGELTQEEEDSYQGHMKSINESAKKLAEAQDGASLLIENREGLSHWFERKRDNSKDKARKREEEKKRKKEAEEKKKQEEAQKKQSQKEQEEEKEEEEDEVEQDSEAVAINLPPPDASVAEAKPVGLAVAGEGGVAASKPIATAVVGPGGLAIARPVGTAIAGVSPDQALVPIYTEGLASGSHRKSSKNKTDQMSEFLNKIISKYHQT